MEINNNNKPLLICKHCGSNRLNKFGIQYNNQRYYCRDCKRAFVLTKPPT